VSKTTLELNTGNSNVVNSALEMQLGYIAYRSIEAWGSLLYFRPDNSSYNTALKSFAKLSRLVVANALNIIPTYDQLDLATEAICNLYYRLAVHSPQMYVLMFARLTRYLHKSKDFGTHLDSTFWKEYLEITETFGLALKELIIVGTSNDQTELAKLHILVDELFQELYLNQTSG
jgi:hypothetical protein